AIVTHAKGEAIIHLLKGTRLQSIVEVPDGFWVAGTRDLPDGSMLLVLKGSATMAATQPRPADVTGKYSDEPVLLTDGKDLLGMVWLEGDARGAYRVVAADWEKTQWGMS